MSQFEMEEHEEQEVQLLDLPESFENLFELQLAEIEPLTQEVHEKLGGHENHVVGEKSVHAYVTSTNGVTVVRFLALSKMEQLARSSDWKLAPKEYWGNEGTPRFITSEELQAVVPAEEAEVERNPTIEHYKPEELVFEEIFAEQLKGNPVFTQEVWDTLSDVGKAIHRVGEQSVAFLIHDFLQEQIATGAMPFADVPKYLEENGMKVRKSHLWNKPSIPEVDRF